MFWQTLKDGVEKLRKWVDEDEAKLPIVAESRRFLTKEYIKQIGEEIESELQKHANPLDKPPFVPDKFVVFLNPADERFFQGKKRESFARTLSKATLELAKGMCNSEKLSTDQINFEIRVDGTMSESDKPRVQAVISDDEEEEDTFKTFGIVEIWEAGKKKILVCSKPEVIVGRKSKSKPPDIALEADKAIGRQHLKLRFDEDGGIWLTCAGITYLNDKRLKTNEEIKISSTDKIRLGEFVLIAKALEDIGKPEPEPDNPEPDQTEKMLYLVEVWQDGKRQKVVPVFDEKVSVGGTWGKNKPEIGLDDTKISRLQAELELQKGKLYIIPKGQRKITLAGEMLTNNERFEIKLTQEIIIKNTAFALRFRSATDDMSDILFGADE